MLLYLYLIYLIDLYVLRHVLNLLLNKILIYSLVMNCMYQNIFLKKNNNECSSKIKVSMNMMISKCNWYLFDDE